MPVPQIEYVEREEQEELSQEQLDGLVDPRDLQDAVGWTSQDEKDAAVRHRSPSEHVVTPVEKLESIRTDEGRRFKGKAYLTLVNARSILPPTYGPRDIDGETYDAKYAVPRTFVKAWLPSEVAAMQERLTAYREKMESEQRERAERRKAILDRIASGDPDIRLPYEERGFQEGRGQVWIQKAV